MKTTFKEENNNYVFAFEGRLDTAASSQTEKEGHDIILDCTNLEYISSSGLRLFLALFKKARVKNSHVYLMGMSDDIRQVFDEIGFTSLFEFK